MAQFECWVFFYPTLRSEINFFWNNLKMCFKISDYLLRANHSKQYDYFEI